MTEKIKNLIWTCARDGRDTMRELLVYTTTCHINGLDLTEIENEIACANAYYSVPKHVRVELRRFKEFPDVWEQLTQQEWAQNLTLRQIIAVLRGRP